jgi:nucleoside-diphosphate-sugar epimerase
MKIAVTGASGFVGTALTRLLLDSGHAVTGLGTSASHPLQSIAHFTWVRADTTLSRSVADSGESGRRRGQSGWTHHIETLVRGL